MIQQCGHVWKANVGRGRQRRRRGTRRCEQPFLGTYSLCSMDVTLGLIRVWIKFYLRSSAFLHSDYLQVAF